MQISRKLFAVSAQSYSSPDLSLNLVKLLTFKLVQSHQKIRELTFNDAYSRTASQILKLADEYGRNAGSGILLDIPLSRQELAEMAGTTRETVSRAVSRFKKEKSVGEMEDRLVILNRDKLKAWI